MLPTITHTAQPVEANFQLAPLARRDSAALSWNVFKCSFALVWIVAEPETKDRRPHWHRKPKYRW